VIWVFWGGGGGDFSRFFALKKYASVPRSSKTNSVPCHEP
jgi:hypothetical protein